MARAAHSTGNGAMLFPSGVDSVEDISSDLLTAIEHATTVLSWQENLARDEMPERWMWPFSDLLAEHFNDVQVRRDEKYNRGRDTIPENMTDNAYAKEGVRQSV